MYPRVLHIYGPVWINSYGLMIALGFIVFTLLILRHPGREKIIPQKTFVDLLLCGLFAGIIGGRLLFIAEQYHDHDSLFEFLFPWVGGFSVLGTVLGVLMAVPLFLWYHRVSILPVLDLVGLYAPVLQSIARLGCFLSGCCYGIPSSVSWAVQYTHPESQAPLGLLLHPTQLYSSLASLCLFVVLKFYVSKKVTVSGQLVFSYVIGEGIARFIVDFWRGDRGELYRFLGYYLSFSQLIALAICVGGIVGLCSVSFLRLQKKGKQCLVSIFVCCLWCVGCL